MLPAKKLIVTLGASVMLAACGGSGGGSNTDPGKNKDTPPADTFSYAELDAATDPSQAALLDLLSGDTVIDESWQLGYQKYLGFKLNGGLSGPGKVSGCIAHQYDALYNEVIEEDGTKYVPVVSEFEALTKDTTVANFKAVTKDSCTDFIVDSLKTQIQMDEWLDADYSQGAPVFSAKADNGWIIQSADENSYARVSVKNVSVVFGADITRQVTLAVEHWNANTAAFDMAMDSPILDFSDQRVFWDLESNTLVTESDDWELSIKVDGRDYPMQVNGGISGSGKAGVGNLNVDKASLVTDPNDREQVYRYFADEAQGVLSIPNKYGPLQYSVKGGHDMWPTFATYLIKDEANNDVRFFKVQVVSNKGIDGSLPSANLSIRYEELN